MAFRAALSELIRIIILKHVKYGVELAKDRKTPYISYQHPLNNGDSISTIVLTGIVTSGFLCLLIINILCLHVTTCFLAVICYQSVPCTASTPCSSLKYHQKYLNLNIFINLFLKVSWLSLYSYLNLLKIFSCLVTIVFNICLIQF